MESEIIVSSKISQTPENYMYYLILCCLFKENTIYESRKGLFKKNRRPVRAGQERVTWATMMQAHV